MGQKWTTKAQMVEIISLRVTSERTGVDILNKVASKDFYENFVMIDEAEGLYSASLNKGVQTQCDDTNIWYKKTAEDILI